MNTTTKILLTLASLAIVALAICFFNGSGDFEELKQSVAPTASLYPEAKPLANVLDFVDDDDSPIHLSQVSNNKWVLMYFGYTSCPDVCPVDLAKISQTLYKMEKNDDLQVVFVSVDPKRDIGKLNTFAKGFNKHFVGLSAHEKNLSSISKALGVYHQVVATQALAKSHAGNNSNNEQKMDSHDEHEMHSHDKNYLVDHTTSYLLFNPSLALSAILSSPHKPDAMAKALDEIITTLR